ncbi:hypothetical protein P5P86_07905 [Nocardioides sp. BP30]|uniref:PDC sensor domain-containing protein n=1 Tax=Nocardioides sp. BP30 TaxID=3036374 RepID=UPI002468EB8C|nr:hypothetical protein [Nocardioides sp. BP30]WGL53743.1 hypothetical protein P5P86_07905 [Nocardioides sp. BP30]
MTRLTPNPALEVIEAVAREAFGLTAVVDAFITEHLAALTDAHPAGVGPRASAIGGLRAVLEERLSAPGARVVGAGFVAAVGLFEDHAWWLEWFVREGAAVQRLQVPMEPTQLGFYDYTTTRWFREPEADGRRHVIGPFVDYLCTEDLTLTFSQPVVVGGRFVGVAACDIRAVTAERELLPVLRRLPGTYVVVNDGDRVLCSNSGRYVCGDLLEAGTAVRRHGLDDLSFEVVEPV